MKRLLPIFLALILAFTLAPAAYADETPEGEKALFTVVGCRCDIGNKAVELALSRKESHYSESEGREIYYYTTTNVMIYPDSESSVMLMHDGSERGKALVESICAYENIPVGTVVEVTWSGMIAETYPLKLEAVSMIYFTDDETDYTDEEIEAERNAMNEMRSGSALYPQPDNSKDSTSDAEYQENPKTGQPIFIALAGIIAWLVCAASARKEDSQIRRD